MTIDTTPAPSRRVSRAAAVTLGLALGSLAAPAHAAPPTSWENTQNGSFLEHLLILGGIPLAIIAVVTLLVYLPSMVRGHSSEPAVAFRERSEWFGGPRRGVDATTESSTEQSDKGGASARW